jgi:hypothetical protein
MCSNYCKNNILFQASVPIQTYGEMREIEEKIKFLIDRPSRNFRFNFILNSAYFTVECSTLEDAKYLQNTKLFIIAFEITDIYKQTRNLHFRIYEVKNDTSVHNLKCFKVLKQIKDQVLVYTNSNAIKTHFYKKIHQSIFRNQIIFEDKRSPTFNNTRIITYNDNFQARTLSFLPRRTKLYEVYQTNAIAIKFNGQNFRPDMEELRYLFVKEGRKHAKFTKLEHEHQLYVIKQL